MPRRSIRAGTWRPAAFTRGDMTILVAWLCALAVVRAVDYILSPTGTSVEETGPIWLWSAGLLIGVSLLVVGSLQRRHLLVWVGHGWLGSLYAGITAVAIIDALRVWDDWRRIGPVAIVSVLHWLLWWRTGPRPVTHPTPTATIAGGGDAHS